MRKLQLLSLFILLFIFKNIKADHLMGGEMTYQCLGNNNYEINLIIYRNCNSTNTNLDPDAYITVFNAQSNFIYKTATIPLTNQSHIRIPPATPCFTPPSPSQVCMDKLVYSGTVNLPASTTGYKLVYQRCCRNPAITNLFNAGDIGSTYEIIIPPSTITTCNNTPVFNSTTPAFMCVNQYSYQDFSATDADGDLLVYSLCAPKLGADLNDPRPTQASRPPYADVPYNLQFSETEPLGPGSLISINAATGLLSMKPATSGYFTVGICVAEYRNGVLLNTVIRDVQFNITNCSVTQSIPSVNLNASNAITQTSDTSYMSCNGLTVSFLNNSNNATTSFWDFGVSTLTNDTSIIKTPTYTFPDTGVYHVTLIINKGQTCGDTATIEVRVLKELRGDFSYLNPICANATELLQDLSTSFYNDINGWKWYFGDGDSSILQNPTHSYTEAGNYSINLVATTQRGCKVTATKTLTVTPGPAPNFIVKQVCKNRLTYFTNQSTIQSGTIIKYIWDFGNGIKDSVNTNPSTVYPSDGTYTITLTAVSDNGCRTSTTKTIEIRDNFKVDFTATSVCERNSPVFNNTSTGYGNYLWRFDDGTTSTATNPTHIFTTAGTYAITLTASHAICASDSITKSVIIKPNPSFTLNKNISFCEQTTFNLTLPGTYDSLRWNTNQTANSIIIDGSINPIKVTAYLNGCIKSDSTKAIIYPKPNAEFLTDKFCANKPTAFLNTSSVIGDNIAQNNWTLTNGISTITSVQKEPTLNLNQLTPYQVQLIVTTTHGCKDTFRNTLSLLDTFSVGMKIPDAVCIKNSNNFADSSVGNNAFYSWNFGDGQIANTASATHTYLTPGIYTFTHIVRNQSCGEDSISKQILVKDLPVVDLGDDIIMCPGAITAVLLPGNFDSVIWNNGSHTNPANYDGNYPVISVTAYQLGCYNSDLVDVILNCDVFIPTAFSPNGDGINDYFNFLSHSLKTFTLKVYNRWGELVFETGSYTNSWNGTYKGKPCDSDDYVYIAYGIKNDNKPFYMKGTVTLLK
ncbi:MAG TPA: PKD domain-containing protein [Chitinophagales bacterium]|nr:PKD domain-containing protein [Chitinophagales bacterium]